MRSSSANHGKMSLLSPQIWKVVDFTTLKGGSVLVDIDWEKMTREVVDRSKGQMEELGIDSFGSDDLMSYVADRTSSLKRLRLISVNDIEDEVLIDMLERQPQLEELEITFGNFDDEILEEIGKACPILRFFRYNQKRERFGPCLSVGESDYDSDDMDANDIASNMPELCVLQLVGISLTNKGLDEILGKCKHLESLDIRYCFGVNVNAEIQAKAERLKEFKLPYDSIYYEYLAEIEQVQLVLEPDDDLDDPWYYRDF